MQQNYNEIYNAFENLIDSNNIEIYFESIINLIKVSETMNELEQTSTIIIKVERKYKNYLEKKYNTQFIYVFQELQNKFVQLAQTLTGNLLPITNMFYLYEFFNKIENLPKSTQVNQVSSHLKKQYNKLDYSSEVQMYISDILLICAILNNNSNAFKEYFKRSFVLNVYNITQKQYDKTITDLISYFQLDVNFIITIMEELFDEKHYFKLSKMQRRSIYNWHLHILWNIQKYYNNTKWNELYPIWKNLLFKHFEKNQTDEAMYLHFFIYHIISNSFQTQEEFESFNNNIDIPASKYYKTYAEKNSSIKAKPYINKKGKIKIALVKDRIANTSITKVELSILKRLQELNSFKEMYELCVFSCNYFEKSNDDLNIINQFEQIGIKVFNPNSHILNEKGFYHDHLEDNIRLRNTIIDYSIDIMIIGTNNYPAVNYLLTNRSAPKQIFWSHGNFEFKINNIDYVMSHIANEESNFLKLPTIIDENVLSSPIPNLKEKLEKELSIYPKNNIILGTMGRLIKLDNPDYINLICNIMIKYPNTIYLACGSGNSDNIKTIINKYNLAHRWFFPGQIDSNLYSHIIDICPNTFPHPQGYSLFEIIYKEKPFISLSTDAINPNLKYDLKNLSEEELIEKYPQHPTLNIVPEVCFSLQTYKNILSQLIENKESRIQAGKEAKIFLQERYLNDTPKKFLTALEEIIND